MKKIKLGELIDVTRGMSLPGDKYAESGDLIRLTLGNFNIQGNGFKPNTSKTDLYYTGFVKKEFIMKKGDIITPLTEQTYGLLGSTARIPESGKYIQSQDVALIRSKSDKLYEDFCYYLISSPSVRKQLGAAAQQTKIRHTSPDKIKDCEVIIPEDVNQQIKITNLLNTIENKIALNNKTNTELENMAKTIYGYWFTQFDFPDKNGHPYKTSGGQMVYNETLKREIPAGWEVKNILDCCKVIDCLHSKKPDYCYEDENCYLLQLENLIDLKLIDLTNKYYVSKKDYETWTSKTKVKQGDLVVTNAGRVGGVSRIPNYIETGIGRNMTSIRPITISEYLLCYFFSSSDCDKQIRQNTDQGAFFQSLNVKGIKKLNLTIPPKEIQDKFDSLVGKMRLQIESNHKENEELTKLRDYLLPLLMNGQIEVK